MLAGEAYPAYNGVRYRVIADQPLDGTAGKMIAIVSGQNTPDGGQTVSMQQFTAVIERDEDWYVALCPELDIASQGRTVEEARRNLIEAIELLFEAASSSEIRERSRSEVFVTQVGVEVA
jgi:predicted RNase H-like HicB family nuclease